MPFCILPGGRDGVVRARCSVRRLRQSGVCVARVTLRTRRCCGRTSGAPLSCSPGCPAVLRNRPVPRATGVIGCRDGNDSVPRIVEVARPIAADAAVIFELIADPARQPLWDGNDNLAEAPPGQRVHSVGDVFSMTLTRGAVRHNHVVEFEEGRLIVWRPAVPGVRGSRTPLAMDLGSGSEGMTLVTHTYDWTQLTDPSRLERSACHHSRQVESVPRAPRRAGRTRQRLASWRPMTRLRRVRRCAGRRGDRERVRGADSGRSAQHSR